MHECIRSTIEHLYEIDPDLDPLRDILIVVDGNQFKPYMHYNNAVDALQEIRHVTVEQGDAKYMGIAAASIVAKVTHDDYIMDMCDTYPELKDKYDIHNNMGYGTKKHLDGIRTYGITQWHRRTFGELCKNAIVNIILES